MIVYVMRGGSTITLPIDAGEANLADYAGIERRCDFHS